VRIAFVSDAVYPWHFGGLEVLQHTEAKELAKEHDVHFFSMRWPGMRKEFQQEGIRYHTFHSVTQNKFYRHGRRSIREALVFTASTLGIFRHRFDVVIANEFPILHLPILKLYCMLSGCKLIVNVYEVWNRKYWTQYLGLLPGLLASAYADASLKVADAYVTISSTTMNNLTAIGVKRRRVSVFSPVIDDRFISGIDAGSKKGKSIIFWGRLIKEKRIDKWLMVVRQMSRKMHGLHAVIIGDGPERKDIQAEIRKLGLEGVVELRHSYSNTDRKALFSAVKDAGLLLQMSEREGLSMIVLESIALGTPVLVPSYSPIPKEVRDMCVVADESRMAGVAARILNSGDKSRYIRNRENLKEFYISNVNHFYSKLFDMLK
jgi:glycosyltransferase involved in cell wall biosynthesis